MGGTTPGLLFFPWLDQRTVRSLDSGSSRCGGVSPMLSLTPKYASLTARLIQSTGRDRVNDITACWFAFQQSRHVSPTFSRPRSEPLRFPVSLSLSLSSPTTLLAPEAAHFRRRNRACYSVNSFTLQLPLTRAYANFDPRRLRLERLEQRRLLSNVYPCKCNAIN